MALREKLASKTWDGSVWKQSPLCVDLKTLPGTISLAPIDGDRHSTQPLSEVPWANGELPEAVKQADGASWIWQVTSNEPREIICLARHGAKLFIDDNLTIECPSDLPYVPATQRSPEGSRVRVTPLTGTHAVRLELTSNDPQQEASVILAYPNLHSCPWTEYELPNLTELQSA